MKHTIKAMTDLLFDVAETTAKLDEVNNKLYQMAPYDDFATHIAPMAGTIATSLCEALDLFFEEITDCESLATHMLYETGIVTDRDGIEYRLHARDEFDNFIQKHLNEGFK